MTSAKVKTGSLLASDFKAGQLPAGPRGATGPRGARGPAGPKGAKGDPGGSGPPTGAAGGWLAGTYPNPTIADNVILGGNIVNGTIGTDIANGTITRANMAPGYLHAYVAGADPPTTNSIFVSVPAGTYIIYGHATVTNSCSGSCDLQEAGCSIDGTQVATASVARTVSRICRSTAARGSTPRVTSPSPALGFKSS